MLEHRRSHALVAMAIAALSTTSHRAQGNWVLRSTPALPTPVADHVLVYDLLRSSVLAFGGATTASGLLNETWRYDGNTWTKLTPATSPPPRLRHAGAFDIGRGRFVVFGGSTATNTGHFNDTWEFDGTSWQQLSPANSPSPRNDHWMAYDFARGKVLLFGGHDTTQVFGDTWQWDGSNWTQLAPVTVPAPRRDFNMVYDGARARIVMFGGFSGQGLTVPLNDTWEWDGLDWTRVVTPASPPARGGHVMAWDAQRQRVLLFSGYPTTVDTWDYDGVTWNQRFPASSPSGRSGHGATYDTARGRVVMACGYDTAFQTDTWEYFTTSLGSANQFGTGCAGTAGTPALATAGGAKPWIGQPLTFDARLVPAAAPLVLLLGASKQTWSGIPLPLDLTILGMTGCFARTSTDVTLPMGNSGGVGTLALTVPQNPGLLGQSLYQQLFVLDSGANPFGATVSNGLELVFGAL